MSTRASFRISFVFLAFLTGILVCRNIKTAISLPSLPRLEDGAAMLSFSFPIIQQQSSSVAPPVTVGYAISLIKCSDKQTSTAGLVDAAIVLRHSIHATSVRNPSSGSSYDYKMYALVHTQAQECSTVLKQVGFEVIVADPPVVPNDIRGEYLRNTIRREWCCGSDEFVKLYAYSKIPEPVVVHVDIDFAFMKPMDELFDAMLYHVDSTKGQEARKLIALETPSKPLPDRIDAFVTRDWPQVIPSRLPGFQAGFMVIRPNATVVQEIVEIIKEGNYVGGFSRQNGWNSSGHGGYVGAMAMQGLMAYYYDFVRPKHVVELNQCRYNWMGMDVRYRAPPNFHPRKNPDLVGRCRNNRDECEDCMDIDLDLVKNVHYTVCRKPWNCVSEGHPNGHYPSKEKGAIDIRTGRLDQCMKVVRKWHEYRTDFEQKLYNITKDDKILASSVGDFKRDVFMGHCSGEGGNNYVQIQATPESLDLVAKLYE